MSPLHPFLLRGADPELFLGSAAGRGSRAGLGSGQEPVLVAQVAAKPLAQHGAAAALAPQERGLCLGLLLTGLAPLKMKGKPVIR